MRDFLQRRWFVLLLSVCVALAWLRPAWGHAAFDWLPPQVIVGLSLFLMAWGLESALLFRTLLHPWPALWALTISYGALPAAAWLLGSTLLSPDLRIGLLLITSVPCTLSSAVLWTRLGGGNEALALLIILLSTGAGWLATSLWLTSIADTQVSLDMMPMMRTLLLVLLVPVALAQASRFVPGLVATVTRYRNANNVVCRLLVCSVILKAVVDLADHSASLTLATATAALAACVGLHLAALYTGLYGSHVLGFARGDGIAVAFACSQKTLPVALVLFQDYFAAHYPLAVLPLVFYHVSQLVIDTFIADALARREPTRAEKQTP